MAEAKYSSLTDQVRKEYNTHSGADITILMAGVEIGTAVSITLNSQRVKTGLWTFGNVAPRAYGRGVREITGEMENVSIKMSLVQTLLNDLRGEAQHWIVKKLPEGDTKDYYREYTASDGNKWSGESIKEYGVNWKAVKPVYLDELLPMDIVCIAVNEFGAMAKMEILGAEFTNSVWAMSVQDVASVERVAFVARDFTPWNVIQTNETTEADVSNALTAGAAANATTVQMK